MTLGADIDPRVISLGKVRSAVVPTSQRRPLALVTRYIICTSH